MQRFIFDTFVMNSVVGGQSALDMPRLNINKDSEAAEFLEGYGFDLNNSHEVERLWYFHRRALVLMEEKLGFLPSEIPEILRDRKKLGDIKRLLLWASSRKQDEKDLQRWSCALLRCMHVFVHSENDLFSSFSEEIQKQILTPFQDTIFHEGTSGMTYLKRTLVEGPEGSLHEPVPLVGFEVKPFKTSTSTVIKLLAKPSALALNVFDKLGLRFVTHSMFDTFKVVRFLVEENLVSFPHIIPDQSSNNLYPVELFLKTCSELAWKGKDMSKEEIEKAFDEALKNAPDQEGFFRKNNAFSGEDYRFIKFISRKLIQIKNPAGSFSFFYPFEVQIMDKASHDKILSGPSKHQAYKERQREAAKRRVLPDMPSAEKSTP